MVDSGIDHYHPHPSHQDHFEVFCIPELEFAKIPEHLYKAIIYYINRFIIPVYITKNSLQAIAIVFLIEIFLISLIVLNTASNNVLQNFQSY